MSRAGIRLFTTRTRAGTAPLASIAAGPPLARATEARAPAAAATQKGDLRVKVATSASTAPASFRAARSLPPPASKQSWNRFSLYIVVTYISANDSNAENSLVNSSGIRGNGDGSPVFLSEGCFFPLIYLEYFVL